MIAMAGYHIVNGATSTGRAWLTLADRGGSARARGILEWMKGGQVLDYSLGNFEGEAMPAGCRIPPQTSVSALSQVDLGSCFPNGLNTPVRGGVGFALSAYR